MHVEQSVLPHACGDMLGEPVVGQSCCGSLREPLVGQSSCGGIGEPLVGRLPARVVELLQSSAVGKPCQDRRLFQEHMESPSSTSLSTTSSGRGLPVSAHGSLQQVPGEFVGRVHGMVGRVGRVVGWAVLCSSVC